MIRSIRWRLQLWYALVLLTVVAGLAGILYYRVRAAHFQAVDRQLEAWAQSLDANLRALPPQELDLPGGDEDTRPYFAVWRADGSVVKASALPGDVTIP